MPARVIRWPNGRRSGHYYPKKRRINVTKEEIAGLIASGDVVFRSYTAPGVLDWRLGRFCFRQPRKTTKPIDAPGAHAVDLEDLWPVLDEKGLGVYRVEGHDADALHIGNNAWWRTQKDMGRNREGMPMAPDEHR
jgi:hypothetical protein